ncbi:hypothetical protein [Haloferax volcanii]|uniref:Uncharacterized protein n=3 Tax=Haloferax volcanii TaxID=2246 RepID=D4GUH2_HALVD|nr:hypothetical protein [Haloferax volcanii]ADE03200.1 uncharacterized protein HVO_0833 [Haloferax volcanii DS2]ELY26304.1 hypothetical protein C498_14568 [Haloferax volcanii DS2]MBS8120251.1 hypothetical protein [Haloferax volcanii]MBS8125289.1 hypothetical protein [Haloferax volcanii]MBS8129157.1 hypothetical protein [Haloferax volcanii]
MLDSLSLFSLFLYGAIVLLAAGFWAWLLGSYVFGWRSPLEAVEARDE